MAVVLEANMEETIIQEVTRLEITVEANTEAVKESSSIDNKF